MAIQISGSWNLIGSYTASQGFYGTASYANTASYVANALITASVLGNIITFTKGNNSTFDIIVSGGGGSGSAFPYTGSAQITGSLDVTGSATVNGTDLQFIGPPNSPYVIPNYTITPAGGVNSQTIIISQSGIHNIDLSNMTPGVSASANIYWYIDQIPDNSETQIVINLPITGSGTAFSYRTLVSCSSATYYWANTNTVGTATSTLNKVTFKSRRYNGGGATSFHQLVKSPYGTYLSRNSTATTLDETNYFELNGSQGTPL